jgi:magnesium transporter
MQPINSKLIQDVQEAISSGNRKAIIQIIDSLRPADVADLIEHLDKNERIFVLNCLEPNGAGEVLMELEDPVKNSILNHLDTRTISEIVQELDSDDAADLVGDLPESRAREVIEAVNDDVSEDLEKLLPFPEDSAGGIMALEFVAVKAESTIHEAIEVIRQKSSEVENLYHVWVVDDYDRLVGVISLKALLLADPQSKVNDLMNHEVISVNCYEDQEQVINVVRKYNLVHVPVVDKFGRLIGRITHDDIMDAIAEETYEDFSLMGGVIDQDPAEESVFKISKARLPWLIVGMGGEILAALLITQFRVTLETLVILAFFFPVMMATGGNTGSQAAILVVRGLATGDISFLGIGKRLFKELKVTFINGITCGIILGTVVTLWFSNYILGIVVAMALLTIITCAGLIGAIVPFGLKRFNVDPALGTGPFVTTSNDIISLFIYLSFVTVFLKYF